MEPGRLDVSSSGFGWLGTDGSGAPASPDVIPAKLLSINNLPVCFSLTIVSKTGVCGFCSGDGEMLVVVDVDVVLLVVLEVVVPLEVSSGGGGT